MGPSSWSTDQTKVHAMEKQGVPCSQEISCATNNRKIMATGFLGTQKEFCFWNSCHTRQPLLKTRYASTMVALCENIKQERRGKFSAGVLLLHDNAPAHKSRTSRTAIRKCGFVELDIRPKVQTWLPVTTSSETLKNFCVGEVFPMAVQSRKL